MIRCPECESEEIDMEWDYIGGVAIDSIYVCVDCKHYFREEEL